MIEVVSKRFVGKGLVEVEELTSIGFRRLSHAVQRGLELGFIDHPDVPQSLDIDRLGNDQNFDAFLVQAFDQFSKSQSPGSLAARPSRIGPRISLAESGRSRLPDGVISVPTDRIPRAPAIPLGAPRLVWKFRTNRL